MTEATPAGRRSPLIPAVIGVVVGVVVTLVIVLLVAGGGSGSGSRKVAASGAASGVATTGAPTTTVPLTPIEKQMLDLLTQGNAVNYHALYTITSPQTASQNDTVTLELWREPPEVRQDTVIRSGSSRSDTAAFQLPSGLVECSQENAGAWSCKPAAAGDVGLATGSVLAQRTAAELVGATVTEHASTIAGQAGSCYDITLAGAVTEVCVNAQGIPLQESSGGSSLTMTSYDQDIPSGTFTPPAVPVAPATPSTPSSPAPTTPAS